LEQSRHIFHFIRKWKICRVIRRDACAMETTNHFVKCSILINVNIHLDIGTYSRRADSNIDAFHKYSKWIDCGEELDDVSLINKTNPDKRNF